MDQNLTNLRRQALKTSSAFLRAQHVYLNAADIGARKSETELKEALEENRKVEVRGYAVHDITPSLGRTPLAHT
jgi:hypothetical protein